LLVDDILTVIHSTDEFARRDDDLDKVVHFEYG